MQVAPLYDRPAPLVHLISPYVKPTYAMRPRSSIGTFITTLTRSFQTFDDNKYLPHAQLKYCDRRVCLKVPRSDATLLRIYDEVREDADKFHLRCQAKVNHARTRFELIEQNIKLSYLGYLEYSEGQREWLLQARLDNLLDQYSSYIDFSNFNADPLHHTCEGQVQKIFQPQYQAWHI